MNCLYGSLFSLAIALQARTAIGLGKENLFYWYDFIFFYLWSCPPKMPRLL